MLDNQESEFLKEIRFETFTPGGPGGQHANRTSSAVRAVHVPTGLTAIARDHRSQHRNRELATARLLCKLKVHHRPARPRISTSPPPLVAIVRRQIKERRSRLKATRRKVTEDS
jgi:protein subunit release factor A